MSYAELYEKYLKAQEKIEDLLALVEAQKKLLEAYRGRTEIDWFGENNT